MPAGFHQTNNYCGQSYPQGGATEQFPSTVSYYQPQTLQRAVPDYSQAGDFLIRDFPTASEFSSINKVPNSETVHGYQNLGYDFPKTHHCSVTDSSNMTAECNYIRRKVTSYPTLTHWNEPVLSSTPPTTGLQTSGVQHHSFSNQGQLSGQLPRQVRNVTIFICPI